jgi:hypothetical protein
MSKLRAEVGASVHIVVLEILERRAVKGIRTGLQRDVGDGAYGAAKLRLVVIRRDINTLDGFRWRNQNLQQSSAFVVVNTLNLLEIADARHTVSLRLQRILRIEELGMLEGCGACARNQIKQ